MHAGAVNVLDFLTETMKDHECVGATLMECIENGVDVITRFLLSRRKRS
jgi:hypothetical protein